MMDLKDRLEEIDRKLSEELTDPRLQYPSVTFYAQENLGCGFAIVSLLPFAALAVMVVIQDPEGIEVMQWFLGGATFFWALTWVLNYAHVGKLRRKGKPGTAVVVDNFTIVNDEGDERRVLIYEFDHPQTGTPQRVINFSDLKQDARLHIGQQIKFLRLPASKILTKLTSRVWPEMWSMTSKKKLANQVTGFAVISGGLLALTALVGFQVLTAMMAFELTWGNVFNAVGDLSIVDYLTSPELGFWYREVAGRYWALLATAGVAVVTVFGAALFQMARLFGEE
jgi:hypothetical protein